MDIEQVIAALDGDYTDAERTIIERVLRDHHGTVPDDQLIEEAALALAIHRRRDR